MLATHNINIFENVVYKNRRKAAFVAMSYRLYICDIVPFSI
jgi:hypothetical protein